MAATSVSSGVGEGMSRVELGHDRDQLDGLADDERRDVARPHDASG
ncbi:MAG TPA: hypothetical protein VE623_01115 [Acidimicrobiales bacterium]|nr:hypothetical protein [Acidimicrobiales bacterium]